MDDVETTPYHFLETELQKENNLLLIAQTGDVKLRKRDFGMWSIAIREKKENKVSSFYEDEPYIVIAW